MVYNVVKENCVNNYSINDYERSLTHFIVKTLSSVYLQDMMLKKVPYFLIKWLYVSINQGNKMFFMEMCVY